MEAGGKYPCQIVLFVLLYVPLAAFTTGSCSGPSSALSSFTHVVDGGHLRNALTGQINDLKGNL